MDDLENLLKEFVGGELEAVNGVEGYLHRGRIASLEILSAEKSYGVRLKVTFEWYVEAIGRRLGGGFVPTEGWKEVETTPSTYDLTWPSTKGEVSAVTLEVVEGKQRLRIRTPYTDETATLFPKGGSTLDESEVRWLPNGPKARADARRK